MGELATGPAYAWQGVDRPTPAVELNWRANEHTLSPYITITGLPQTGSGFVAVGVSYRTTWRRLYWMSGLGIGVPIGARERREFGSAGVFNLDGAVGFQATPRIGIEAFSAHWSNGSILRIYKAWPDVGLDEAGIRLRVRY